MSRSQKAGADNDTFIAVLRDIKARLKDPVQSLESIVEELVDAMLVTAGAEPEPETPEEAPVEGTE